MSLKHFIIERQGFKDSEQMLCIELSNPSLIHLKCLVASETLNTKLIESYGNSKWTETFECCDTRSVWWQVRLHLIPRHLAPHPNPHPPTLN